MFLRKNLKFLFHHFQKQNLGFPFQNYQMDWLYLTRIMSSFYNKTTLLSPAFIVECVHPLCIPSPLISSEKQEKKKSWWKPM